MVHGFVLLLSSTRNTKRMPDFFSFQMFKACAGLEYLIQYQVFFSVPDELNRHPTRNASKSTTHNTPMQVSYTSQGHPEPPGRKGLTALADLP